MPQNQLTSFITTASGFAGGMTRAFLGKVTLTAITLQSLVEVVLYAGTSALVGYGVKLGIDCLKKFINRRKQNRDAHE
jgi:hypothetical protein